MHREDLARPLPGAGDAHDLFGTWRNSESMLCSRWCTRLCQVM